MIKMLSIEKMKEFALWLKANPRMSLGNLQWKYEKLANKDSNAYVIDEALIAGDKETFTKQLMEYALQY